MCEQRTEAGVNCRTAPTVQRRVSPESRIQGPPHLGGDRADPSGPSTVAQFVESSCPNFHARGQSSSKRATP